MEPVCAVLLVILVVLQRRSCHSLSRYIQPPSLSRMVDVQATEAGCVKEQSSSAMWSFSLSARLSWRSHFEIEFQTLE